jgi:hypothetical protein
MALVQLLLDQHPGPLPIKGTFQCLSTEVFDFIVSGVSVRKPNTALGAAGVEISITDKTGKEVGYTSGTIDGTVMGGRRATIAQFGQTSLNAGETYNFEVRAVFPECASDAKDFYTATIIY